MRSRNKEKVQWIFGVVFSIATAFVWTYMIFTREIPFWLMWIALSIIGFVTLLVAFTIIEVYDDIYNYVKHNKFLRKQEKNEKKKKNDLLYSLDSSINYSLKVAMRDVILMKESQTNFINGIQRDIENMRQTNLNNEETIKSLEAIIEEGKVNG